MGGEGELIVRDETLIYLAVACAFHAFELKIEQQETATGV